MPGVSARAFYACSSLERCSIVPHLLNLARVLDEGFRPARKRASALRLQTNHVCEGRGAYGQQSNTFCHSSWMLKPFGCVMTLTLLLSPRFRYTACSSTNCTPVGFQAAGAGSTLLCCLAGIYHRLALDAYSGIRGIQQCQSDTVACCATAHRRQALPSALRKLQQQLGRFLNLTTSSQSSSA